MPRLIRFAVVAALAAGILAGCGKRGALEPAETPQAQPDNAQPGGIRTKRVPITAPKRDLVIERLLD